MTPADREKLVEEYGRAVVNGSWRGKEVTTAKAAMLAAMEPGDGAEAEVIGCGYMAEPEYGARPYLKITGDGRLETFGPGDLVLVTKVEGV